MQLTDDETGYGAHALEVVEVDVIVVDRDGEGPFEESDEIKQSQRVDDAVLQETVIRRKRRLAAVVACRNVAISPVEYFLFAHVFFGLCRELDCTSR